MPHPQVDQVNQRALDAVESTLELLADYLRHPAISCEAEHASDVRNLANRIRDDLEALGMDEARVLELDGALPCVAAEWLKAGEDKPTVLIYGHLDLQPVPEPEWESDPHVATRRGGRLYARGAADDMGGWVSHFAAIASWFKECGTLPCNVKMLIEGEEEIGSPNLERFMDAYPEAFDSDVMVLTDCENPSTDVPGLTVSLRGLIEVELLCEALDADVHSGLWGGMVPDVSIALIKLIDRLTDDDGRMVVGRMEVPEAWRASSWDVPLTLDTIRSGAKLMKGVDPLPDRGTAPAEWLWRQPSMTVVATTLPTPEVKKNALRRRASAILSIRVPPGMKALEMLGLVKECLSASPPAGVKVTVSSHGWNGESWLYTPKGPAFPAADRAYEKAWGKKLVQVGIGGSIPFVALFGRRFGDLPLILNGVMDPETVAHGPNESLHLGVFEKAISANVYLLDELGALDKASL
jgi:acetylornithine deacetylase/succinyl-diaminopimelate desuccinylase-like protein